MLESRSDARLNRSHEHTTLVELSNSASAHAFVSSWSLRDLLKSREVQYAVRMKCAVATKYITRQTSTTALFAVDHCGFFLSQRQYNV